MPTYVSILRIPQRATVEWYIDREKTCPSATFSTITHMDLPGREPGTVSSYLPTFRLHNGLQSQASLKVTDIRYNRSVVALVEQHLQFVSSIPSCSCIQRTAGLGDRNSCWCHKSFVRTKRQDDNYGVFWLGLFYLHKTIVTECLIVDVVVILSSV
jgi:hypothetical protein